MPRIILFNGPPYSGKTTAAGILSELLRNKGQSVHRDSFAAPMKHYLATLIGERYEFIKKDEVHPALNGHTPRQFLIKESEDHMKPTYGVDVYGRALAHRITQLPLSPTFIIIDDSGFIEESEAMAAAFGLASLRIIRVLRPDHTFANDSRGYIEPVAFTLDNDGDEDNLRFMLYGIATQLIGELE